MTITEEQLKEWEEFAKFSQPFRSPKEAKELRLMVLSMIQALREEWEKVRISEEFILWLTPCGQESGPPTYELIGKSARETFAKLRGVKE